VSRPADVEDPASVLCLADETTPDGRRAVAERARRRDDAEMCAQAGIDAIETILVGAASGIQNGRK
jgi:hypothetical protein